MNLLFPNTNGRRPQLLESRLQPIRWSCALRARQTPKSAKAFTPTPGHVSTQDDRKPHLHRRFQSLPLALTLLLLAGPLFAEPVIPALSPSDRENILLFRKPDGATASAQSPDDWKARRTAILTATQSIMGRLPGDDKRCPLDIRIEEEMDRGTYILRLITYASQPGPDGRTPAYLCIPKTALEGKAAAPGVLCLHPTDNSIGHKVVVGLGGKQNRQYASELAERGFVTIAPSYPLLANYQPDLKALGFQSGTMKAIWDNSRALDVLDSLPFVKHGRYATIGHSLGGHNSVYTAVFDDRLKVIVSSCGLDRYGDYYDGNPARWAPEQGWCQTRYMPRLADYKGRLDEIPFDFPELLAALAPRDLYINAPLRDSNFRWKSVDLCVDAAKKVYALHGKENLVTVDHPDSDHDFPDAQREKAYALIEKVLK
jgi:dienelactone hydrolase